MKLDHTAALSALLVVTVSTTTLADKPADRTPAGYKLLYSNSFDDADATKGFEQTDPNAWRFSKEGKRTGALEQ